MNNQRMLFISPVRDEADFIRRTIESVVGQTIKPDLWIIVDDGSADRTAEIVEEYQSTHPWIVLKKKPNRGKRAVGPGVVESFYFGLSGIDRTQFDFICKLDGDIELDTRYFELLLSKFAENPKLGAASGKPFITVGEKIVAERTHDEMVAGQVNFYRTECFNAIDGFVKEVHWDGIAFHRARMEGWQTRSFSDVELRFRHLRIMGSSDKGLIMGRLRWGKGQYFIGTHPVYLLGIGLYRTIEKPFLVGGACIVLGYFQAFLRRDRQYDFPGFKKALRAWQFQRIKKLPIT